jgi:hypothetical protein
MRAILVCVDYADLLGITLPWNRHHFEQVVVVTSPQDKETQRVANHNGAIAFLTDAFYRDGADFNKFLALEQGLDFMGRVGWLCCMDADVLWPKRLPDYEWRPGNLYAPFRRMFEDVTKPIPAECDWGKFPRHHVVEEFSGYSQIFYASDQHLGAPPWHETNWRHCGGSDSMLQLKWPNENKIRPPFEVLHLGPAHVNWCGRVSPYTDGSCPEEAQQRSERLKELLRHRFVNQGGDPYIHEKLSRADVGTL